MRRISHAFEIILGEELLRLSESSSDVVFGLWPDLTLAYLNPAWFHFARLNGAREDFDREWPLGRPILDSISEPLKAFYQALYFHVIEYPEAPAIRHSYECSSPTEFREYTATVQSLVGGHGILVSNTPRVRVPVHLDRKLSKREEKNFLNSDQILHHCSHCRKSLNHSHGGFWTFEPAWIADLPPTAQHELCPSCEDKYQKDIFRLDLG